MSTMNNDKALKGSETCEARFSKGDGWGRGDQCGIRSVARSQNGT